MKHLFPVIFCFVQLLNAQNPYPQDYFRPPLDIPLILSGTFAELRANHFHSGLDIKTQHRRGLSVYATADGFVSRIKISHFGYGKALYITHPNGYTTVYAHLQKFAPKIEAYIKQHQYGKESFEIEVFPGAVELKVGKGEVVAYSGNTGGSGGPHLHFEIRDNQERPINPLLFGLNVKDTTEPHLKAVYAYPLDGKAHVNHSNERQKLRLIPLQNGDYKVEDIQAFGNIGFGIVANDRLDLASNSNGLYNIRSLYNGQTNFEIDFKRFSFSETRYLNRLIDYGHYKQEKERIQKLFVKENNPLSLYKNVDNKGVLRVEDSTSSVYKVRLSDKHNNASWLNINIKGTKSSDVKQRKAFTSEHYVYANQNSIFQQENVEIFVPKNTFYDDFYVNFKVKNDTITFGEDVHPAKKSYRITYDLSRYKESDRNQLYIAELVGYYQNPYYTTTKREGDKLIGFTKYLGTFAMVRDTVAPTTSPRNFKNKQWMSKYRYLKLKIDDKGSGISRYRATVNGKWILMEYDYKTDSLVHDFNDGVVTDTENNLKVIVTDNVGNSTTFETVFYRKNL